MLKSESSLVKGNRQKTPIYFMIMSDVGKRRNQYDSMSSALRISGVPPSGKSLIAEISDSVSLTDGWVAEASGISFVGGFRNFLTSASKSCCSLFYSGLRFTNESDEAKSITRRSESVFSLDMFLTISAKRKNRENSLQLRIVDI